MKRLLPLTLAACIHTSPVTFEYGTSTNVLLNQTRELTTQNNGTTIYIRRGDTWRHDGGYFDQWNNQIFAPKTNLGFTYFLDRRTLKITSNTNNCNETYIIDLTEKDNSFYSLENCNNLHNALTSNEDLLYRDIDPEDLTFIEARIDDLLNIEIEKTSWNR
ncbi:hypothetical protein HN681_00465 [archaeon]|jgi:hypothetical protein|nr:hypothetical protein [archaeon]MBT3730742.1 hypothetical protein [archaeon]MBT4669644.1 hypothetical protein [archaeon]MBT5030401.1 hypothetical protein [archaeon]MBT5288306.1 hypothetical protein [archaeon]